MIAKAGSTRVVVANATDGAPAVASARRAAAAFRSELLAGLSAAAQAAGAERAVVAVEERARELDFPDLVRVADVCDPPLPDGLILDVQALIALGTGAPMTARVVTVAGAVARPGVGLAPIGTCVEELIAAAGGPTCGPAWVALDGGPLGGRPLDRDDVVTRVTRAIFVGAAGSDLVRRARLSPEETRRRRRAAGEHLAACDPPGRLSVALAARRLGIADEAPPWTEWRFAPAPVAVPLDGAAPVVGPGARVRRGQPIAPGAHASIDGVVIEVGASVWISPAAP
jgi:hypothetical protein